MSGTTINPYRFGGQLGYRRDGTNRNYVRARHVNTAKGRWISQDPIGIADGWNKFLYVNNNPITSSDPSGLFYYAGGADCRHFKGPSGPFHDMPTSGCNYYEKLCQEGYAYGCNALFFCKNLKGSGSGCVRSCLQAPKFVNNCNYLYCLHWWCFDKCKYSPPLGIPFLEFFLNEYGEEVDFTHQVCCSLDNSRLRGTDDCPPPAPPTIPPWWCNPFAGPWA